MNCELPQIKDLTFEEYMKYSELFNIDVNSIGKQYKTKRTCVKEGCYKPSRFNKLCFMHGGDNRRICNKNKCYKFAVIKGVCNKHNPKKQKSIQ